MASHAVDLGSLTILATATDVAVPIQNDMLSACKRLAVYAPGTLPETVNVVAGPDEDTAAASLSIVNDGADAVVGAGKVRILDMPACKSLAVRATVAVAADRVFRFVAIADMD